MDHDGGEDGGSFYGQQKQTAGCGTSQTVEPFRSRPTTRTKRHGEGRGEGSLVGHIGRPAQDSEQ